MLIAYVGWKYAKKTKIVSLQDIPLEEALQRAEADVEIVNKQPRWKKIVGFLWD